MQVQNLRQVLVTAANNNAGDNVIVPANQFGPNMGTIKVWQVELNSNAANTITPRSGATQTGGQMVHTGAGASTTLQATGEPWFRSLPGQPLVLNMTTGGATTGTLYYSLA